MSKWITPSLGRLTPLVVPIASAAVVFVPPAEAAISVDPAEPTAGIAAVYTASPAAPEGLVEWDLDNDGEWDDATGNSVRYVFAQPGTYQVRYRVSLVLSEEEFTTVVVQPNAAPQARFTYSPAQPVAGQAPAFDASDSSDRESGRNLSYAWDFGDDGTVDSHDRLTYKPLENAGVVLVRLTVTDEYGNTDSTVDQVRVKPVAGSPVPEQVVPAERVVFRPSPSRPNQPPKAAFRVFPHRPRVGDKVALTSYSSDANGFLKRQSWDIDQDGDYDDGSGAVIAHYFRRPGQKVVRLRVEDSDGVVAVATATFAVRARPARLLSPFPIVRLAGRVTRRATRITRLSVRAPAKASIRLRCRGRGCPFGSIGARSRTVRRPVRFRRAQRSFRSGQLLEVSVTRKGAIGKFTRFRLRKGRRPARTDGCLRPGAKRPGRCPAR